MERSITQITKTFISRGISWIAQHSCTFRSHIHHLIISWFRILECTFAWSQYQAVHFLGWLWPCFSRSLRGEVCRFLKGNTLSSWVQATSHLPVFWSTDVGVDDGLARRCRGKANKVEASSTGWVDSALAAAMWTCAILKFSRCKGFCYDIPWSYWSSLGVIDCTEWCKLLR